jgi:hypothetical protein
VGITAGNFFQPLVAAAVHEFRTGEDDHELPFRLCGEKGIRQGHSADSLFFLW